MIIYLMPGRNIILVLADWNKLTIDGRMNSTMDAKTVRYSKP